MAYCKDCEFFTREYNSDGEVIRTVCNRYEFDTVVEESGLTYEVGEIDTTPYHKACDKFSKKEKTKWH